MIYLDASFLVSLYSLDAHSAHAIALRKTSVGTLLLTPLSDLELVNALWVRVFRGQIAFENADESEGLYRSDLLAGHFQMALMPEAAFARANSLSRKLSIQFGTRAVDVLHVAAALELGAVEFFSFDLSQREMAKAAGLSLCPMPKRP